MLISGQQKIELMKKVKEILQTNIRLKYKWKEERNRLFSKRPDFQFTGSVEHSATNPWILAEGIWNDNGVWIDTETWRTV